MDNTSFKLAKSFFASNLKTLLETHNYTATSFTLLFSPKLQFRLSVTEVQNWLAGTAMPSVYCLYKLAAFFRTSMDAFFTGSTESQPSILQTLVHNNTVATAQEASHSMANCNPQTEVLKKEEDGDDELQSFSTLQPAPTNHATAVEAKSINTTTHRCKTTMAKTVSATTLTVSPETLKKYKTATAHSNAARAKKANPILAYRITQFITKHNLTLKDFAASVNTNASSLRDYMLYGRSLPAAVAKDLSTALHCTYTAMGITYNNKLNRFTHVKAKTTK